MWRNQNQRHYLTLALLALLWMAGCKPDGSGNNNEVNQDSIPVRGDWVRIYQSADPDALHPYNSRNAFATFVKENIFLYLYDYDIATIQPYPALAKEMAVVSPDGLQFTYEFRPEATWDDGSPITAHDFVFSAKAVVCPLTNNAHQRGYYTFLKDITVDPNNERRFTVSISQPFFLAERSIAGIEVISEKFYDPNQTLRKHSLAAIMDPANAIYAGPDSSEVQKWALVFNDDNHMRNPEFISGPGPYRVESWTTGDNVTLVRKDNWWGDKLESQGGIFKAYPEKLIYKTITDRATLPSAAQNGEIDVVRDMSPDDFVAVRDDSSSYIHKNFNIFTPQTYAYIYIGMNCRPSSKRNPAFEDPKVRMAFNHLVDVKGIIANVYNGLAQEQYGPLSPLHPEEYNPNLKRYEFNLEKAKALLDEAGWADSNGDGIREKVIRGRKVKLEFEALISNTGETGPRMLAIIADQAKQAGMVINVNRMAMSVLSQRITEHDFDLFGLGFSSSPLPTDLWQLWHTRSWSEGGSNYFGFGNAESDSLIEKIRTTLTAEERKPLYHRFQDLWMESVPMVVIHTPKDRIWIHKRFMDAKGTSLRPGYKVANLWVPKSKQKFK